jgi:hypothetical protein
MRSRRCDAAAALLELENVDDDEPEGDDSETQTIFVLCRWFALNS